MKTLTRFGLLAALCLPFASTGCGTEDDGDGDGDSGSDGGSGDDGSGDDGSGPGGDDGDGSGSGGTDGTDGDGGSDTGGDDGGTSGTGDDGGTTGTGDDGGTTGTGGTNTGQDCIGCVTANCMSEAVTCYSDTDCSCYSQCLFGGMDEATCQSTCGLSEPPESFDEVAACVGMYCATECGF